MVITSEFNSTFESRLLKLNCNFINKITEYGLIISGSYVISCILNENYSDADIDIYVPWDFMCDEKSNPNHPFDFWIIKELGGILYKTNSYANMGKHNYKYICPDIIINIINVGVSSKLEIRDHILKTSDIDICTSTYDGFECVFPVQLLLKKGNSINYHLMNNFVALENDEVRFVSSFILKRKTRLIKYKNRGISIASNIEISEEDEISNKIFVDSNERLINFVNSKLKILALMIKEYPIFIKEEIIDTWIPYYSEFVDNFKVTPIYIFGYGAEWANKWIDYV